MSACLIQPCFRCADDDDDDDEDDNLRVEDCEVEDECLDEVEDGVWAVMCFWSEMRTTNRVRW